MARGKVQQLTELILGVFRVNGALCAWGDEFAAVDGLSTARWQMLGAVALSEQPLTAPQLASRMGMTRQGAQKQLNLLIEEGVVETRPNPMHRRSPHYFLTQRGRAAFQSINDRWEKHAAQVSLSLRGTDLAKALEVLEAVADMHSGKDTKYDDET